MGMWLNVHMICELAFDYESNCNEIYDSDPVTYELLSGIDKLIGKYMDKTTQHMKKIHFTNHIDFLSEIYKRQRNKEIDRNDSRKLIYEYLGIPFSSELELTTEGVEVLVKEECEIIDAGGPKEAACESVGEYFGKKKRRMTDLYKEGEINIQFVNDFIKQGKFDPKVDGDIDLFKQNILDKINHPNPKKIQEDEEAFRHFTNSVKEILNNYQVMLGQ